MHHHIVAPLDDILKARHFTHLVSRLPIVRIERYHERILQIDVHFQQLSILQLDRKSEVLL